MIRKRYSNTWTNRKHQKCTIHTILLIARFVGRWQFNYSLMVSLKWNVLRPNMSIIPWASVVPTRGFLRPRASRSMSSWVCLWLGTDCTHSSAWTSTKITVVHKLAPSEKNMVTTTPHTSGLHSEFSCTCGALEERRPSRNFRASEVVVSMRNAWGRPIGRPKWKLRNLAIARRQPRRVGTSSIANFTKIETVTLPFPFRWEVDEILISRTGENAQQCRDFPAGFRQIVSPSIRNAE